MANTTTIKTGDTWPPLTWHLTESCDQGDAGWYLDGDNNIVRRIDLKTAPPDSLRAILKAPTTPSATTVEGPMVNAEVVDGSGTNGSAAGVEPGLGVPENRGEVRYPWQSGDTDVASTYKGEVEVTWDSGSTPPAVETFPNDDVSNFTVIMKPDLD